MFGQVIASATSSGVISLPVVSSPGARWCAGRHLDKDIDWLEQRLVVHEAYPINSKDIGHFVRIDEDRCRPARSDRLDKTADRQHSALDMHVAVAQAGNHEAVLGIDDDGAGTNGMEGIRTAIRKSPARNGDILVFDDFAGLHIDPPPAAYDEVSWSTSRCNCNKNGCNIGPRSQTSGSIC